MVQKIYSYLKFTNSLSITNVKSLYNKYIIANVCSLQLNNWFLPIV